MDDVIGQRIPILLIADCEPDLRETAPGLRDPWIGFERFFEFLSAHRKMLTARTGVPARFSWFWRMDPQIELTYGRADWPVRTYANQVAETKRWGDEAGVHVHAWRWDPALCRWIADHANQTWVEHCVRSSLAEFERAFGEPCRIFRFGDGWLDDPTVELIERLGVHIDLTIEPECAGVPSLVPEELSTGSIPDRRNVPARPYHPSATDFRKPDHRGDTRLWMLPVSTGKTPRRRPPLRHPTQIRAWLTSPKRQTRQINLGMEHEEFMALFRHVVSRGVRPYAAICVRTDVGSNEGLMRCVEQNLLGILDHPLVNRFMFTVPTDALERLVG